MIILINNLAIKICFDKKEKELQAKMKTTHDKFFKNLKRIADNDN